MKRVLLEDDLSRTRKRAFVGETRFAWARYSYTFPSFLSGPFRRSISSVRIGVSMGGRKGPIDAGDEGTDVRNERRGRKEEEKHEINRTSWKRALEKSGAGSSGTNQFYWLYPLSGLYEHRRFLWWSWPGADDHGVWRAFFPRILERIAVNVVFNRLVLSMTNPPPSHPSAFAVSCAKRDGIGDLTDI